MMRAVVEGDEQSIYIIYKLAIKDSALVIRAGTAESCTTACFTFLS